MVVKLRCGSIRTVDYIFFEFQRLMRAYTQVRARALPHRPIGVRMRVKTAVCLKLKKVAHMANISVRDAKIVVGDFFQ